MKVNPKIDLVFKKLFGSEENKDILMSLINAILPEHQQICTLTLKNPYNVSDYVEGKLSILDIKAEDDKGNLYDIEMQLKAIPFYGRRTLYYWAKLFGSQLDYLTEEEIRKKEERGKSYLDLNKCIIISLMDFEFFKDDRYYRCFTLKDRDTNDTHIDLDYMDLYFIELEKFERKHKKIKSALDRWITFLNNANLYYKDTLPPDLAEIPAIRKANERLEIMYLNKKEREYYESQQKHYLDEATIIQDAVDKVVKEAVEKAVQEAVKKIALESKIEMAKIMLKTNESYEKIALYTGLSLEEIEKLNKKD